MKYKNKEFPFWGYHKFEKILYRIIKIGEYNWFNTDIKINGSYTPGQFSGEYVFSNDQLIPSQVASKLIEVDDIPIVEKKNIIKNIF